MGSNSQLTNRPRAGIFQTINEGLTMKIRRYLLSRMSLLTVGIVIAAATWFALVMAATKVVDKFKGVA